MWGVGANDAEGPLRTRRLQGAPGVGCRREQGRETERQRENERARDNLALNFSCVPNVLDSDFLSTRVTSSRKLDIWLSRKENSNSHGARLVY